jgi:acetyl esterase/lipase
MLRRFGALIAAAVGFVTTFAFSPPAQAQNAARLPTTQEMAVFPTISSLSLSPDGKRMAALQIGPDGERIINVWDTSDLKKPPLSLGRAGNAMKFVGAQFVKDDILFVTAWQRFDLGGGSIKAFVSKGYVYDLRAREWREVVRRGRAASDSEELENALATPGIISRLAKDPDHILVSDFRSAGGGDIVKVNVRNGSEERIERMPGNAFGVVADRNGVVRGRTAITLVGGNVQIELWFRNPDTNAWELHLASQAKDRDTLEIVAVGIDGDPAKAFIRSSVGRDKAAIYEYDLRTRKKLGTAFESPMFEMNGVLIAGDEEILAYTYDGPIEGMREYQAPWVISLLAGVEKRFGITRGKLDYTDPATGKTARIDFPTELRADLVSAVDGGKIAVVAISGPRQPAIYYLVNNGVMSPMGGAFPNYDANTIGSRTWVTYAARDGLPIPSILTKPNAANFGPGPYPTVIMPHGGPWARDSLDFDGSFWPSLFASRGIAVLQPQYRGSYGFGNRLWEAGDGEWGQKMQDDKDDGVKWMIAQGVADPQRVAMYGFSYGGYAALAAAVRPNGLYQCAIGGGPVSDIRTIFADFFANRFFRQRQEGTIRGLSPIDKADEIQIPLMMFTGDRDNTTPPEQAQIMYNKAKAAGKQVEFHLIKDFDHGPAWTRSIYQQHLDLIDEYLRNDCGPGGLYK